MRYKDKLEAKELGVWKFLRGNRNEQYKRYKSKYPEKIKAYRIVESALRSGKIIKPNTCQCGLKSNLLAHHEDYSKPLKVLWLCQDYHNELHGKFKRQVAI